MKSLQYARPISLPSICDIKKTTSGMYFYFFLNNGEISVVCMLHATGNHGNWPVLTWHWYYSIHHSQSRPDIYNMFKHLNRWETDVCFFILCGPMTEWEEDLAIDNAKKIAKRYSVCTSIIAVFCRKGRCLLQDVLGVFFLIGLVLVRWKPSPTQP